MADPRWTAEQEQAITLKGCNVLVSAAAGAGKTSVLVERVIRQVLDPVAPLDLERLLAVTFTEKAAAEMKQRVRASLEEAGARSPGDPGIARQMSLLDRAQISTIHAFCLHVIRRYFYKADLDPSFRVLDENEAELLRQDALSDLFEALYQDESECGETFRGLVDRYGGRGIDEGLQSTLLRLHNFARTQASMEEWLAGAVPGGGAPADEEALWGSAWMRCILDRAARDLSRALALAEQALSICGEEDGPSGYAGAVQGDVAFYRQAVETLRGLASDRRAAGIELVRSFSYARLGQLGKDCSPEKRQLAQALRNQAKDLFGKVKSYAFMRPASELAREIEGTRPFMECLVRLVRDLDRMYTGKKRDRGGLDFSDLERDCLDILERDDCQVARDIRREFDCVLVDEYQDTNPLQERILSLVSRQDGPAGNMFMVGDLKQSIYRFRLAEPRIFLEKLTSYPKAGGETAGGVAAGGPARGLRVDLSRNFRSRDEVISAVNCLFDQVMREDVAEIEYRDGHALTRAASYPEVDGDRYAAELHLIEREDPGEEAGGEGDAESGDSVEEFEALEKETLVVAARIEELVDPADPFTLWDGRLNVQRPCSYRDVAILMRSTKDRANAVLEVLSRCDIPAYADTGAGYFQAREVEVALSLLSIIDNPRQDIPLAAVLRSPVVGLEAADLARIRAGHKDEEFYDAVRAFAGKSPGENLAAARIAAALTGFLEDLDWWRTMARRRPLAEVLWTILRETGYHDYVGGLPGGAQRQANLRALCDRAREFDSFGRHGLFRFLRFIQKIQEAKGDLGTARALGEHEDVVRVMSVHKAKGLEFPVVFVMDLGKRFNVEDSRQDVLFHRDLGIGALYCDLENRVKYPTGLHQALSVKIREENLAEEMRVLYVALTRAKEKLVLVGSARDLEGRRDKWKRSDPGSAVTCLDWICPAALELGDNRGSGAGAPFSVHLWGGPGGHAIPPPVRKAAGDRDLPWRDARELKPPSVSRPEVYREVARRLEWRYPHQSLTTTFSKMSVGEMRRRLEGEEEDAWRSGAEPAPRFVLPGETEAAARGAERGIAVHSLLAHMRLDKAATAEEVAGEARRLLELGFIGPPGVDEEDIRRVAAFFARLPGQGLCAAPERVRREVPFTMKVPARLFAQAGGAPAARDAVAEDAAGGGTGEAVVVQGVIDVLVQDDDGLVILDYKTDRLQESEAGARAAVYAAQVSLYALAAERILRKPVKRASIVFLALGQVCDVAWRDYLRSRGFDLRGLG